MKPATGKLSCSFCGKAQADVRRLIAGPGSYICDACVPKMSAEGAALARSPADSCSFCGKKRDEVKRLAAGPATFICNECLKTSAEVLTWEVETPGVS